MRTITSQLDTRLEKACQALEFLQKTPVLAALQLLQPGPTAAALCLELPHRSSPMSEKRRHHRGRSAMREVADIFYPSGARGELVGEVT